MRIYSRVALLIVLLTVVSACQLWTNNGEDEPDEPPPQPEEHTPAQMNWLDPVDAAVGDAVRGPWRMNDSRFHYVDDPAPVLFDGGDTAVVWVDNERQDVFFQRFEDGTPQFDEPTDVSENPGIFSWLPAVDTGPDGEIYVLWQEIVFSGGSHGGEIFFSRSVDGGESFDDFINLSETTAGAGKGRLTPERWHNGSLDLAVSPDGDIYAVWTEYEGALRFSRSTDGGETFTDPVHIAGGDDEPMRGPTIDVDADGAVYLAWTVGQRETADIQFARLEDGESFEVLDPPAPTDGHSDGPALVVDADGTIHLVFGDSPAGPFQQYRVLYTRSNDGGETFGEPTELSDTTAGEPQAANFPSIAAGANGRIYVVWEHFPDFRARPVGLGFARSTDGGESFSDASFVPETIDEDLGINGGLQGLLTDKIDADDTGRIAITNSRFLEGVESRVRLIEAEF